MALQYKFVELSPVTDDMIEDCVNTWVGQGWALDAIRFVTTEHSKRPQLAFVSFTRELRVADGRGEPVRTPPPLVRDDVADGEPAVITAAAGADVE